MLSYNCVTATELRKSTSCLSSKTSAEKLLRLRRKLRFALIASRGARSTGPALGSPRPLRPCQAGGASRGRRAPARPHTAAPGGHGGAALRRARGKRRSRTGPDTKRGEGRGEAAPGAAERTGAGGSTAARGRAGGSAGAAPQDRRGGGKDTQPCRVAPPSPSRPAGPGAGAHEEPPLCPRLGGRRPPEKLGTPVATGPALRPGARPAPAPAPPPAGPPSRRPPSPSLPPSGSGGTGRGARGPRQPPSPARRAAPATMASRCSTQAAPGLHR